MGQMNRRIPWASSLKGRIRLFDNLYSIHGPKCVGISILLYWFIPPILFQHISSFDNSLMLSATGRCTCPQRANYCNSLLINLPASLIQRLQSVQNAAAMLIFNMKRSEHITDALISFHWLRVPEQIIFKVATLTFRALHGTALPYMTSQFTRVADMPNRRRLRSASSNQLDVPSFRLPTVGSRAFPIAGAKVWNSLPDDVTSAPSLSTFRRHLKTYLFRCCYNTV